MDDQNNASTKSSPDTAPLVLGKAQAAALISRWETIPADKKPVIFEIARRTVQQRTLDAVAKVAEGMTTDLATFFKAAWIILEPEVPLSWSFHYDYLTEWLTLIANGEFKKRYPEKLGIIISVPPRSGKSLLCTVIFPVWTWLEHPERRFLCASYSGDLAIDHASKRRYLVKSAWFQKYFADRFQYTVDKTDDFRNDRTGYFISTSIEGSGTGFGGDICIGDDLLSGQEARNKAVKKATNDWLDSTFRKRLNNPVTGCFVHISQRLAADDPTGHLLGTENPGEESTHRAKEWVHIKIKREAEEDEVYTFPKSGHVFKRLKGDILQPERCPPHVLENMKSKSREWAGQEQQEPAPSGGVVFRSDWWRYYPAGKHLPAFDQVVLSVDCAFKSAQDNDYVAIQKYGITGRHRILLWRRTEHLGYIATKAAIKADVRAQKVEWCCDPVPAADLVLIEDKANGPAIIEELRADPKFGIAIVAIKPTSSKDSRAYAASSDVEAGNVILPEDAPWIGEFTLLFSQWFGEGSILHDDDIDAMSQLVNWARQRVYGLSQWYEEQAAKLAPKPQTDNQIIQERVKQGKPVFAEMPDGRQITLNAQRTGWVFCDTGLPVQA